MDRARILDQLCMCLKRDPPADCDWAGVLALANRSLVTPALAAALAPHAERLPSQARLFMAEVRRRNRERNRRLWLQLNDAVAALNAAGIEPVLLKGAALWASSAPGQPFDRLLSDVDLMVPPAQVKNALAAFAEAGFETANRYHGASVHVVAELGRPQDVGYIDLHQRAPGPPGLTDTPELAARRRTVQLEGGGARAPDAASQMLHLVLHDQFHDGDYWRGGFDLRHLMDLAHLAPTLTLADWKWLRRACGSRLVRAALEAQLVSAHLLIGGFEPPVSRGRRARRTHQRWRLQYAHPVLRLPLALLTVALEWPDIWEHGAHNQRGRRRLLGESAAEPFRPAARLDRFRRIARVASGKI